MYACYCRIPPRSPFEWATRDYAAPHIRQGSWGDFFNSRNTGVRRAFSGFVRRNGSRRDRSIEPRSLSVTFVESDLRAVQLLQKNLQTCQLFDRAQVRVAQAAAFLERKDWWGGPYDVLFGDPPYAAPDELDILIHAWRPGLLSEHAAVMIEHDSRTKLPTSIDHAALVRRYIYGDTALYLYGVSTSASVAS